MADRRDRPQRAAHPRRRGDPELSPPAPRLAGADLADVPDGDDWLGRRERDALAGLTVAKRRADWRLGRWAAKRAVADVTGRPSASIELLAGPDGAPDAYGDDERVAVSVSWSHRAGRAVAAVVPDPVVVGVDLELLEARSGAFVREWFSPSEQDVIGSDLVLRANLLWTAKEAAAKVRREGLRLDVRSMSVSPTFGVSPSEWSPIEVTCPDAAPDPTGWWRAVDGFVTVVVTSVPTPPPVHDAVASVSGA